MTAGTTGNIYLFVNNLAFVQIGVSSGESVDESLSWHTSLDLKPSLHDPSDLMDNLQTLIWDSLIGIFWI